MAEPAARASPARGAAGLGVPRRARDRLGHRRADALAGRRRAAAVRERRRDRGGAGDDHPHVRPGLGRALQPGRLARRRDASAGSRWRDALAYIPAQVAGCVLGAITANGMFALAAVSISTHHRASAAHLFSEAIATAGLLLVIFSLARTRRLSAAPAAVGAYIGAAYFFTSSASFANPRDQRRAHVLQHVRRHRACVRARLRLGAARRRRLRDRSRSACSTPT